MASGNIDGQVPGLAELVRGPVAAAVLRALIRDQERQLRNGVGVQPWVLQLYKALQEASGVQLPTAVVAAFNSPPVARIGTTKWVGVMEAAARTGRSDRQIRRLASSGRVIAKRIGHRIWLVDLESLENVLKNQAA